MTDTRLPIRLLHDHWVPVEGRRVFSRISAGPPGSTAPPIVHVHGFGISGRYLEPTAMRLAAHFPVHVPDLPGHGRSENPARLLGISGLAHALVGYLDAMAVPRAVLLGNSLGCLVAAEFAHKFPERTESAVLVSPAGGPHNRPLPRGLLQLLRDSLREPPALARIAIPDYLRYGMVNSLRMFRAMAHYPTENRLSSIDVPFLAVVGVRDPLVSVRQLTRVFHSPAEVELVYQFDAAHAINFSHPDALARMVLAYLQGRPLHDLADGGKIIAQIHEDAPDARR
jgi:pimeloyl-ACP methyl ester carboxylesterase